MYLENKDTGEARVGRVTFSRTFQTIYYKNKVFRRAGSEKIKGNFFDVETREENWMSGCKNNGRDYQ